MYERETSPRRVHTKSIIKSIKCRCGVFALCSSVGLQPTNEPVSSIGVARMEKKKKRNVETKQFADNKGPCVHKSWWID